MLDCRSLVEIPTVYSTWAILVVMLRSTGVSQKVLLLYCTWK